MKDQKVAYINKELHAKIKALAAEKQMTLTELIEHILDNYHSQLGEKKC